MTLINIKTKHIGSMFIIDKFYVVTTTILFRSGELHRSASNVYQFKPKRTQSHSSRGRLTRVSREGTRLAEDSGGGVGCLII